MQSLGHRLRRLALALPVFVAIAGCCTYAVATAATARPTTTASSLTGSWAGKYSGAYRGTFTLHWKQTRTSLSGTIKLSTVGGKLVVTGTVVSSAIRFGTVGSTAITYTGSVSGSAMSGTYTTPGGGGSWSAHKIRTRS